MGGALMLGRQVVCATQLGLFDTVVRGGSWLQCARRTYMRGLISILGHCQFFCCFFLWLCSAWALVLCQAGGPCQSQREPPSLCHFLPSTSWNRGTESPPSCKSKFGLFCM